MQEEDIQKAEREQHEATLQHEMLQLEDHEKQLLRDAFGFQKLKLKCHPKEKPPIGFSLHLSSSQTGNLLIFFAPPCTCLQYIHNGTGSLAIDVEFPSDADHMPTFHVCDKELKCPLLQNIIIMSFPSASPS